MSSKKPPKPIQEYPFIDPYKNFDKFLDEVTIWIGLLLKEIMSRKTMLQRPIWDWLRDSTGGGLTPFKGVGAYTCSEMLNLAGACLILRYCIVTDFEYRD